MVNWPGKNVLSKGNTNSLKVIHWQYIYHIYSVIRQAFPSKNNLKFLDPS